jgi:hypothetical protein
MLRALRLAGLLCAMALAPAWAGDARTPTPTIEPARAGTQCIADPATMRREHPAMLEHQRDATVHGGIRDAGPPQAASAPSGGRRKASGGPTITAKASLKACIACHASTTTGSVAASDTNFCVSCHSYTAVRIDCFGCHATKPSPTAFHPIVPTGAGGALSMRLAAQLKAMPAARREP